MMTGRDLIVYILENNLENEPICQHGKMLGFISAEEAALKFDVGVATVAAWAIRGQLPYIMVAGNLYVFTGCGIKDLNEKREA